MLNKFIGRGVLEYNGITWPEYVNGSPLSASDLNAAQEAAKDHQKLLAQATGYGVVNGLFIRGQAAGGQNVEPNVLHIDPGLGITRAGGIVYLPDEKLIKLRDFIVRTVTTKILETTKVVVGFRACSDSIAPLPTKADDVTPFATDLKPGVYVLVARPDTCIDVPGVATPATTSVKEGVSFYLYGLQEDLQKRNDDQKQVNQPSLDRNRRAYWHFGTNQLTTNLYWPFDFDSAQPYADAQQTPPLSDLLTKDVLPLAVVVLLPANNGSLKIELVDNWPVRRRMVQAGPAQAWEPISGDRRAAEGQARFYQFQEHLSGLISDGRMIEAAAENYFRWLPPVGFLPMSVTPSVDRILDYSIGDWLNTRTSRLRLDVNCERVLSKFEYEIVRQPIAMVMKHFIAPLGKKQSGINVDTFFCNKDIDYVYTDVQAGHQLLNLSWYDPPIDLQNDARLRIYVIFPDFERVYKAALVFLNRLFDNKDELSKNEALVKAILEEINDNFELVKQILAELQTLDVQNPAEIDLEQSFSTLYGVFTRALFYDQRKANGFEVRGIGG